MPLLLALRFWEQLLAAITAMLRVVRGSQHVLGDHSRVAFTTVLRSTRTLGGTWQRVAVIVLKARVLGRLAGPGPLARAAFATELLGAAHVLADSSTEARVLGAGQSAPRELGDVQRGPFATTLTRMQATFTLQRQAVIVDG